MQLISARQVVLFGDAEHIATPTNLHIRTHLHPHIRTHLHTYTHRERQTPAPTHLHPHTYTHPHAHTYAHTHTHIHIDTPTPTHGPDPLSPHAPTVPSFSLHHCVHTMYDFYLTKMRTYTSTLSVKFSTVAHTAFRARTCIFSGTYISHTCVSGLLSCNHISHACSILLLVMHVYFSCMYILPLRMQHFWKSCGWCPPDPHPLFPEFFATEDVWQNHLQISSVPRQGIAYVRIHYLFDLIGLVDGIGFPYLGCTFVCYFILRRLFIWIVYCEFETLYFNEEKSTIPINTLC